MGKLIGISRTLILSNVTEFWLAEIGLREIEAEFSGRLTGQSCAEPFPSG